MFKKKIMLFGKAVPIVLVALVATATLAGAVWGGVLVFSSDFLVSSTEDNSQTVNRVSDQCSVLIDVPSGVDPTFCDATVDPNNNLSVNIDNASPGDQYEALTVYSPGANNSTVLYAQPLDISPWGKVLDLISDDGCGQIVQPGGPNVPVSVTFEFDTDGQDTDPSTSYGPFPIVREFSNAAPTCP